jgi:hypothetical protein
MIIIKDNNFVNLGVVKNAIRAQRIEQLNGEYTLNFEAILNEKVNAMILPGTIFELNGEYFDLAMYEKIANEDGTYTVNVESEQVSYRLNDAQYNMTDFAANGTASSISNRILAGTGFNVRTLGNFPGNFEHSAQGEVTRRQLLMAFVTLLEGEIIFDKFDVSIVNHRGSTDRKLVTKDRHVKVISHVVDKRDIAPNGDFKVVYTCEPIYLPADTYNLGDDILLMNRLLGICEELRVVSLSFNPYNNMDVEIKFAKGPMEWYTRGIEKTVTNPPVTPPEDFTPPWSWDEDGNLSITNPETGQDVPITGPSAGGGTTSGGSDVIIERWVE